MLPWKTEEPINVMDCSLVILFFFTKKRGPGLESGTKQTQNRPKWLLEEERVPGVGCETFFREEKQQKRPKCREEIERIEQSFAAILPL